MGASYRRCIIYAAIAYLGVCLFLAAQFHTSGGKIGYSDFTSSNSEGTPVIWKHSNVEVVIYGLEKNELTYMLLLRQFRWLKKELGVTMRIVGKSSIAANRDWYKTNWPGRKAPPVNISFSTRYDSDLFISSSTLAATTANPNKSRSELVTGAIVFDTAAFNSLSKELKVKVIRHELGHLMGFGHDNSDVMGPQLRGNSSNVLREEKILIFKRLFSTTKSNPKIETQ